MQNQLTALSFSGGLDSACAWWILGKPDAVYCGGPNGPANRANVGELNAIRVMQELNPQFRERFLGLIANFGPFQRRDRWKFPRDQITTIMIWAHGYNKVLLAWCKNDGTSYEGMEKKRANLEACTEDENFKVEFPTINLTKAELIQKALGLGAPREFLLASHSCVRESAFHCGECINCCQRFIAFKVAGVDEPDDTYLASPQKTRGMVELVQRQKGKQWFEDQAGFALGRETLERLKNAKRL